MMATYGGPQMPFIYAPVMDHGIADLRGPAQPPLMNWPPSFYQGWSAFILLSYFSYHLYIAVDMSPYPRTYPNCDQNELLSEDSDPLVCCAFCLASFFSSVSSFCLVVSPTS